VRSWQRRPWRPAASTTRRCATTADGHNWAAYGRTFGETHYSPLAEINRETVPRLNLAWTLDLDVTNNLSTPLAVEGVIYVASGLQLRARRRCQDGKTSVALRPRGGQGRRHQAAYRGGAFVAWRFWKGPVVRRHARRCRLIANRCQDPGKPVWSVQTLDQNDGSFISGPPRVFNDKW
jgi:quinohemoprotein ethanol dehydrogenase